MNTLSHQDWSEKAQRIAFRSKAFVDGDLVPARSGRTFRSINPATGETLAEIASCSHEDVDVAVNAARKSFSSGVWSRKDPAERKAVLLRLSGLIRENLEEFALLESLDMGKLVNDAASLDVPGAASIFQWYAEAIDKVYGEIAPTSEQNLALIRREPLGVVGAVVPWNFPLDMAAWKCAPALSVGNSVVLKPAEQASLSALRLAELAMEAGLPAGVLNVVPGFGATAGQALGRHMDVDCLAFTGSTPVGKMFLQYSGQSNVKQVWLETGGKSPNIVFSDYADRDRAVEKAAAGIFYNQGQVCSAASRLLIERSAKDDFLERLVARCQDFQPGDPLDPLSNMGAMVDAQHTARVMQYIEAGRKSARLVAGGEQVRVNDLGCYISPTIFDDVSPENPLAREEIFGPVLVVIPFDTEEEAIGLANDSCCGPAASVWTDNLPRAHRVATRLNAGTVSVNTVDALSPMTLFGGMKQSGFGRDLSLHALDKYTALKTTWITY